MLHDDVLTQLFPVEMAVSPFPVEGAALDRAEVRIDELLPEMFPGTADALLPRWEALYEIAPPAGATLQERQAALLGKYRLKGSIRKPFFIALAASLGYTVIINDYAEPVVGFFAIGDTINYEPWMEFNAGVSMAGDYLAQEDTIFPWIWEVVVQAVPAVIPTPTIEELISDLKPAHILIHFTYP